MQQGVRSQRGKPICTEQRRLWQALGPGSVCEAYTPCDPSIEHDDTERRGAKLVRRSPGFRDSSCQGCAQPWIVDVKPHACDARGKSRLCVCKIRFECDGRLVVLQCVVEVFGASIQIAQIEMGSRILRVADYCKLIGAAGLIDLVGRVQNIATVQVRARALRVSFNCSVIPRHSLGDPSLFFERIALVDRRYRPAPGSFLEICHPLFLGNRLARCAHATQLPDCWRLHESMRYPEQGAQRRPRPINSNVKMVARADALRIAAYQRSYRCELIMMVLHLFSFKALCLARTIPPRSMSAP